MHIAKPVESSQEIEHISKNIVAEVIALSESYQEMQQALVRARIAFYCACLAPGIFVAKAMLAPFVVKEK